MALINRISRLFKADFHAVLDQIEEPEALLKQAIRDMEDDLASTEQRINLCMHDQEALAIRKSELDDAIAEFAAKLDLCFESDKDDLARSLIRKKLEAERLLKRLEAKHVPGGRGRRAGARSTPRTRSILANRGRYSSRTIRRSRVSGRKPSYSHNVPRRKLTDLSLMTSPG